MLKEIVMHISVLIYNIFLKLEVGCQRNGNGMSSNSPVSCMLNKYLFRTHSHIRATIHASIYKKNKIKYLTTYFNHKFK